MLKLINKTSNGLKCFNCHFIGMYVPAFTQIVSFAKVLCVDADWVINRMDDNDTQKASLDNQEPVFLKFHKHFGIL